MKALSPRLEVVLDLLTPCRLLADVGTDHGLLPAAAVERGVAEHALAIDVLAKPLAGAERNLRAAGLLDRITVRHEDGLDGLHDRGVDAVVIAGMGGRSMRRICDSASDVLSGVAQIVVQPNAGAELMREFAFGAGFHLSEERMIREGTRFFVTCRFESGDGADPAYDIDGFDERASFVLGPIFLQRRDPVARAYFETQRDRLRAIVEGGALYRAPELDLYERACALSR